MTTSSQSSPTGSPQHDPWARGRHSAPQPPVAAFPDTYGPPAGLGNPYPQGYYGAPPQAPQPYGHHAPYPQVAAPAPANGLGTAGFVLGLLALLFAWIPLVGVVGWPLSILGLLLAGLGLHRVVTGRADNRGLTIAGLTLSALALIVCIVWAVAFTSAVASTSTGSGSVSGQAAGPVAAAPAASASDTVGFGQTFTYGDGLAVTIAAPQKYTPSSSAYPQDVDRAVLVTVTVTNGSTSAFDVNTFGNGPNASFAGAQAPEMFDSAKVDSASTSTLLPGKTYTYEKIFSVGTAPGEMQLEWTRDILSDPVIFTGQV
ncbi:sulfur globule family protein [Pseudonocardia pini]|uniref:sulfur globule family protein n=1 Tax=Pseudonocardia pini TaxID=2758030 RepID=UPI0015F1101C|nr:sulfur globule family protein [Pseudonocardia pini]